MMMPDLGVRREKTVFVSGIGCAARFPYYMNTYGVHSIHGRAPSIATGLAVTRPDLDVWVICGDGDALSIGGNHFIHALRRNIRLNIMVFNNQIYGLTKGQYSPTSETGKVTKSTPFGSIDHAHNGAAFVEVYQNCNVFNDGAFEAITGKANRSSMLIPLVHGEPIRFGDDGERGVVQRTNGHLEIVDVATVGEAAILRHDAHAEDPGLAFALSRLSRGVHDPTPIGVFRSVHRQEYGDQMTQQVNEATEAKGKGDLAQLFRSATSWTVD